MNFDQAISKINTIAEQYLSENMTQISGNQVRQIGIDTRGAYTLYISEEYIAVEIGEDCSLQYYGGFEYVDADYRQVMGDYVFYSAEDSRVADHIDNWINSEDQE